MSRKLSWLIMGAVALFATLCLTLYSKQVVNVNNISEAATPLASKPIGSATPAPTPATDTPKAICTLNVMQAPAISGLQLRMPMDQTLAMFPGSRDDVEVKSDLARTPRYGVTRFVIRPEKYTSPAGFAAIKSITFTFMDGRMSAMSVGLAPREWKDVDEYIAAFSKGKSLPAIDAWDARVGLDTQLKTLTCDGFEIAAFAGGKGTTNYIQMRDLAAEKELIERRAKAMKQAEKEAKP